MSNSNSAVRRDGKGIVWTQGLIDRVLTLYETHERKRVSEILGISDAAIRAKLGRLGITAKVPQWTEEEESLLIAAYQSSDIAEEINLTEISKSFGRDKANVCRKARELGLTNQKRRMVVVPKIRVPKFATKEDLIAHKSQHMKGFWMENKHPRGMLGKRHTEEAKARMLAGAAAWRETLTEEQQAAMTLKANKTRARNGTLYPTRINASWKAGWREIGGYRKYYRSKWEANYAHYLQWLKERGEIQEWKHEPKTFWFEGIKRGTNSYLPDFWVQERSGAEAYHEVKGWMDDRSKTKIRRMAKYHPSVRLIVIDAKAYAAIKKSVQPLIPGWEP